jgi:hypothetical protein
VNGLDNLIYPHFAAESQDIALFDDLLSCPTASEKSLTISSFQLSIDE